jgi:23S rRNA pseudouridine955/2504/2580 synthase
MQKSINISLIVEDNEGMRFDRWLRKTYPALTQGTIEKLLRLGKIRVDGKKVKSNMRINLGQVVEVPASLDSMPQTNVPKQRPVLPFTNEDKQYLESFIIWEDDDLLVINKPMGLASQGGSKTYRHIDGLLSGYGEQKGIRYHLVHRLDRDTSGVLIIAKSSSVANYLGELFHQGKVKKVYWAIVVGHPKPGQGVIDEPLLKGGDGNYEKVAVNKSGKPAITHYRTIKGLQHRGIRELTWLELTPETGRTHQLRVHLAHISCPIIGDGKYGKREATASTRELHLHARSISIPDRSTGKLLTFQASPPPHFVETLKQYNLDWESVV